MKFGSIPHQVEVNTATRDALFRTLRARFSAGTGFALATLNLDPLTKLPTDKAFLNAYREHDIIIADGRPVVWLAALARKKLELMPGSDMVLPLCEISAEMGVPVALIGSSDAALLGASEALRTRIPGLVVNLTFAPPYGFDPEGPQADQIFDEINKCGAGLCLIALGAPKQEIFAARGRALAPAVGFASVGAALDFLSGHQVRAPKVMRMLALEWLWRVLQSPARMVPRYARCFAILPGLMVQALRKR